MGLGAATGGRGPGRVGGRASGIGVLGGTFDPVHAGHVAWAVAALRQLDLAAVVFVVAGDPWMKTSSGREVTPGRHRLEMVRLAIRGRAGLVADDRELRRPGPSRTVETLEELAAERPGERLHLLIGADCLETLALWSRPGRVLGLASVAVLPRPGVAADLGALDAILPGAAARATVLSGARVPFSSSAIRTRLAAGRGGTDGLDGAVAAYAQSRGLYRPR